MLCFVWEPPRDLSTPIIEMQEVWRVIDSSYKVNFDVECRRLYVVKPKLIVKLDFFQIVNEFSLSP